MSCRSEIAFLAASVGRKVQTLSSLSRSASCHRAVAKGHTLSVLVRMCSVMRVMHVEGFSWIDLVFCDGISG